MYCRVRNIPVQNLECLPLQRAEVFVPDPTPQPKMNRRALLLGAVFLVGGAAALTRFARGDRSAGGALAAAEVALLETVSDVMIPDTDTPGALAAGVPQFVRTMLEEWASNETRARIAGVLEQIDKRAWVRLGASFAQVLPEQRHELLRDFDAAAFVLGDEAYARLKFLVLAGYYHSEIGATQELHFEMVPGTWRACLPLDEIGRASAV
jgi:hypothetical protein